MRRKGIRKEKVTFTQQLICARHLPIQAISFLPQLSELRIITTDNLTLGKVL